MNVKENGIAAFPTNERTEFRHVAGAKPEGYRVPAQDGMTLRDYFAAQIASGDAAAGEGWGADASSAALLARAEFYYALADVMLKARNG